MLEQNLKNKPFIDAIIIGAGVSGMTCALSLREKYPKYNIVILEKSHIGKKIKVSGNGRCNIAHVIKDNTLVLNDTNYQKRIFLPENIELLHNFIENTLGLLLTNENGLYYPYSKQSVTVYNAYRRKLKESNILIYNEEVTIIKKNDGLFTIVTPSKTYETKKLVIASGSCAYYSDYNGDFLSNFLKEHQIKFNPFKPGLTGYLIKEDIKILSGLRAHCKLSLIRNGNIVFSESGEVQFKDDGISGIVVMNSSNVYQRLTNKDNTKVVLDFIPDLSKSSVNLIYNSIDERIINYLKNNSMPLTKTSLNSFILSIKGVYGFDYAQIAIGGVDLSEIKNNYESIKVKNLYFIGEVLDVSGFCGGYNMMNAIISGLLCAKNN